MTKPVIKVELQIDETARLLPFFTLNDSEAGVLDNTQYPLGGLSFVDISEYVTGVTVKRGISRELERTNAGVATVVLNNNTRLFDPENPESNFSTQLLPHREIRISANGTAVYLGLVEDWNIEYDLNNNNTTTANCVDKFTLLAQQVFDTFVVPVELPGPRMERVLDRPEVAWDAAERDIAAGHVPLLADVIELGDNVLTYLNDISFTEDGAFFIAKDGKATLQDGLTGPSTFTLLNLSDQGDGIPFTDIQVIYGSELLYNRIEITNIQDITLIGDSFLSQVKYGITTLARKGFLANIFEAATAIITLLNRYDEPEYRFERVVVELTDLSPAQQIQVLRSELTDSAYIRFRPNKIGPVIEKYAQIIGIAHEISSSQHRVEFRFRTLDYAPFVLDDPIFGVLGGTNDKYLGGSDDIYNKNTYEYDEIGVPYTGVVPDSGIFYDSNQIEYDGRLEDGNRLG